MPRKKRNITGQDLYKFDLLSGTRISPDGNWVAWTQHRVDQSSEKKYSNIWVASTDKGTPKQFTHGDHSDSSPKWSPDSKSIAFMSNRGNVEKPPQIYIIPFDGGEARKLTDIKGAIGGFRWAPDGKTILLLARKTDKDAIERETDEKKKKLGIVARHYERIFYKYDGMGFLPKENWHIWTVNTKNGKAKQLTDHDTYAEGSPVWSPEGDTIAFISNRTNDPDREIDADDIYVMPASGGEFQKINTLYGSKGRLSFSPDGKLLAYISVEGSGDWWKNTTLYVVPTDGSAPSRNLTGKHDIHLDAGTINDMGTPEMMSPTWSKDGQRIYFQEPIHGKTVLRSIDLQGEEPQTHIDEKGVVSSFTFDNSQKRMAYFYSTLTDHGQVRVRNWENGSEKQITKINNRLMGAIDLGETEEVWFKGPEGDDLQGWILKPPGFDPKKKYPSILEIHGGPMTQYGNNFMHEFYYLAAKGYVVYYTNPRGGRGYGEAHTKAIWNDWGNRDYADIMAWVDVVSKNKYIDKKRMGVTGGSYGGYMTNWIIGHTDRFNAAVTQRSICNLISFYGSTDGNWIWQQMFGGKPPWEDLDNYWRMSPLKYISNAKTPTLIIHSEEDHRCPIEQAEQLFVALKRLEVDTELVRFPNEPHGLSRMGRTDRRIERLDHIARWFDKYL